MTLRRTANTNRAICKGPSIPLRYTHFPTQADDATTTAAHNPKYLLWQLPVRDELFDREPEDARRHYYPADPP